MKNLVLFTLFILTFVQQLGAAADGFIMTVSGPIHPEQMGMTLIHEHILVDFIGAEETGYHRWNKTEVAETALPHLEAVKSRGLDTFFELTPAYIGRDPELLEILVKKSGLQIVTNTGYYGVRENKFVPQYAKEATAEELAARWISEFEDGIEDTGVRPGFIKIGVDRDDVLSDMHRKIVTAAALTHKATGLTIVSHTGPDGPAFAQIELLKSLGVSPSAFVWTHAQGGTLQGYLKAYRERAWISLDNFRNGRGSRVKGMSRLEWFVDTLSKLKAEGVLHKVLISHDSGWYRVGEEGGGQYNGYTDIFDYLVPALKEHGFSESDIEMLLIRNPRKAYTISRRLINSGT